MIKNTERQLISDLANYLIEGLNYEEMKELYSTIRSRSKDSKTIGDIYIWRFIDDKASYSLRRFFINSVKKSRASLPVNTST